METWNHVYMICVVYIKLYIHKYIYEYVHKFMHMHVYHEYESVYKYGSNAFELFNFTGNNCYYMSIGLKLRMPFVIITQSVNGITGCHLESYWTNFLFVAGFLFIK